MITHFDFRQMSQAEQAEAVWRGTFLGDRREKELWIQCYSLETFYVEVFYDAQANQILKLESFTQVSLLAPYLPPINFNDVEL